MMSTRHNAGRPKPSSPSVLFRPFRGQNLPRGPRSSNASLGGGSEGGSKADGNEREPAFKASRCDLDEVDSAPREGKNCPRKERNGTEKVRWGEMTVGGRATKSRHSVGYTTSTVPRFTMTGRGPASVPAPLSANFARIRSSNTKGSSANDEGPAQSGPTETVFPFRALPSIPWTNLSRGPAS